MSQTVAVDMRCSHRHCDRKAIYRVFFRCVNCDWEGWAQLTKGHEALGHRCPVCETRSLLRVPVPDDDDSGMATEAARWWT